MPCAPPSRPAPGILQHCQHPHTPLACRPMASASWRYCVPPPPHLLTPPTHQHTHTHASICPSSLSCQLRAAMDADPAWQTYVHEQLQPRNAREDVNAWQCGRPTAHEPGGVGGVEVGREGSVLWLSDSQAAHACRATSPRGWLAEWVVRVGCSRPCLRCFSHRMPAGTLAPPASSRASPSLHPPQHTHTPSQLNQTPALTLQ
jgi:hypothetical protein